VDGNTFSNGNFSASGVARELTRESGVHFGPEIQAGLEALLRCHGLSDVQTLLEQLGRGRWSLVPVDAEPPAVAHPDLWLDRLLSGYRDVLHRIATGLALPEILQSLNHLVESLMPGVLCSVLLLEEGEGGAVLRCGAAASFPAAYNAAVDGMSVGACNGSCGTAVHRRRMVVVPDIAHDPLWAGFRALALDHGLRACWSTPIAAVDGVILGTFAMYFRTVRFPASAELRLLETVGQLAAIAIERRAAQDEQRARVRAENRVEEMIRLDRLKDDFLSTASHELRTPLTNMKLALQMLQTSGEPERQKQYLQMLRAECERETVLINNLLDLQRLERGRIAPRPEPIALAPWLEKLLAPFKERAAAGGQVLTLTIQPVVESLCTDPELLERVAGELLNNACKYTPAGGRITVSADRITPQMVCLHFANEGTAIPADELPQLFEPFYRGSNRSTGQLVGTGLGLALVRQILANLGGTIAAQSSDGWIVFTVYVPELPPEAF
jgi:signal transduction histidine kinase